MSQVIWFGAEIVFLALISGFFMFLMRQFIIVVSRLIEFDLKNEIYSHYQRLDMTFYKKNNTGDLMNRISEDVGKVRMYVGPAIMYLVNTIVTVATVLVFMIKESPELSLIVILPLPVLSFIIFRMSNVINAKSGKVQEQLSFITSRVQETFSGIRLIKAYGREKQVSSAFANDSENYRKASLKLSRTEAMFQPFMVLMVGLSLISIIYFGGTLYMKGEISIGSLPQFVFYVYNLTWPFASLGWISSLIQRAAASQERINQFLETEPDIKNENTNPFQFKGKVEFKNVDLVYPETGIKALQKVNFTIEPNETLAIIGNTGSGKSSIANLLLRMMDVSSGEILIDGQAISKINLEAYRSQTGYVPQDVFLFSDSIRNNINFAIKEGSSLSSEKQNEIMLEAAKNACIHDNIMAFADGFETIVGERGITLSGGQKQRVSIARAITSNPSLLIFDDCLNAVDVETEDLILRNLKSVMKQRTTIIISQRVSTVKDASKIIFLKNGCIVEEGTHQELLNLKGNYAEVYSLQAIEHEKS